MTRKTTHEEFVNKVFDLVSNEYEVLTEYQSTHKKVKFVHNECGHVFEISPSKFIHRGQRCPKHKGERISKAKIENKRTQFLSEFKRKRPDLTLLGEYKGNKNKVMVKSLECNHSWGATPTNLLSRNSGCPHCKGLTNTEGFVVKMMERYGSEFEILGEYKRNTTAIKVKHRNCGGVFKASPKTLLSRGNCPKCMQSNGEAVVDRWLYNEGFDYEMQYRIGECRNTNPLPFDFMVNRKDGRIVLIEVDGSQHFQKSNYWGKGSEQWEAIKRNDEIKNEYCKQNGITLLRIPYWWFRNSRFENELIKALKC